MVENKKKHKIFFSKLEMAVGISFLGYLWVCDYWTCLIGLAYWSNGLRISLEKVIDCDEHEMS